MEEYRYSSDDVGEVFEGGDWGKARGRFAGTHLADNAATATCSANERGNTMVAEPFGQAARLLAQVGEGMAVFDRDHHKIGEVKDCYLGGEDLSEAVLSPDSAIATVPQALRSRLAASGFVEIAPGLLQAHRYATGSEVAAVDAEGVHLNVTKDELLKK